MAGELKWNEIAPDSLPPQVQTVYAEYKAEYRAMKEARAAFEAALNGYAAEAGVVGEGQELAVAYNFGKLSVAIAPKRERKAKGKGPVGLGEIGRD